MDLELLRNRILSGITKEQFEQEFFYFEVPMYRLKHHLEYSCDKNLLKGKNCFKCIYNLYPDRKIGTECGILKYVFAGKVGGSLFINQPQKSVCAFCKTK